MTQQPKFLSLKAGEAVTVRFLPPTEQRYVHTGTSKQTFTCKGASCPVCAAGMKAQPRVIVAARDRAMAKISNFGRRYGNPVHVHSLSPQYGKRAARRNRPKRIAKKIDRRGGWTTYHAYHGASMSAWMFRSSRQLGLDLGVSLNRKILERWNDANQDVIDELVALGVPRAERQKIYRALRRMVLVAKDPGDL